MSSRLALLRHSESVLNGSSNIQQFCSWFESFYNFERGDSFGPLETNELSKLLDITCFYSPTCFRDEYPGYTSEDDVLEAVRQMVDVVYKSSTSSS